jgi:hypothetical protein
MGGKCRLAVSGSQNIQSTEKQLYAFWSVKPQYQPRCCEEGLKMPKSNHFKGIMALMVITVVLIGPLSTSTVAQDEGMLYLVEFKANETGAPM